MRSDNLYLAFKALGIALAVWLGCQTATQADETMRCGSYLVTSRATIGELVKKCGEPLSKQSTSEDVLTTNQYGVKIAVGKTVTERWTYRQSNRHFPRIVTIVDGKIISIEAQD
jgi:hypothetical protein